MRTPNKRPEFFWPRQVLKKLLNLKSNGSEFNADDDDDDDQETSHDENDFFGSDSSEQECRLQPESRSRSLPPRYPIVPPPSCPPERPKSAKQSSGMIMRGQSETLWTNFVDMQDYRIYVGTWNVAGKSPTPDLDLREWLNMDEAADMYVIGFQEIVPLNAGNVLGAEDAAPAYKWEALIRKTLNSNQRRAKSAPPSPGSVVEQTGFKVKEGFRESPLSQPQKNDDAMKPSGITGKLNSRSNHRKTHSASEFSNWSLQKTSSDVLPKLHDLLQSSSDSSRLSIQIGDCNSPSYPASADVQSPFGGGNYVRIISKQMVGIFITVWIRKEFRRHVHHLKVSCVGCGLMGYYGNKGSIAVSLALHQTSFCFVCTHLTSGEREGDELRRNADVSEILRRTSFFRPNKTSTLDLPETIMQHERIIWLGDLNYRLTLPDNEARALIVEENWESLLEKDQLKLEQNAGRVFEGWEEGAIYFAPTYKYIKNSSVYFGENSKPGEKRRTPSWCDRILWRGRGLKEIAYFRSESQFSDHRPVSAVFIAEVEAINNRKLKKAANISLVKHKFTSAASNSHDKLEEAVSLIRSLKPHKLQENGWSEGSESTQNEMSAQVAVY